MPAEPRQHAWPTYTGATNENNTAGFQNATPARSTTNPFEASFIQDADIINPFTPFTVNSTTTRDEWQHQLKRVPVPVFSGDKKDYERWWTAFSTCVDRTPANPEYKMLRLQECLKGEALKIVDGLGYSARAYDTAKSRLEKKYGGERRASLLRMDECVNMKPIRDGKRKELENYYEKLETAMVILLDQGRMDEFEKQSTFYCLMKKKLSEKKLEEYKEWLSDYNKEENLNSLAEWIERKVRIQTEVYEDIHGFDEQPNYERVRNFDQIKGSKTFIADNNSTPKQRK